MTNEAQRARQALLDMALEERVGGASPPDLWPAIRERQRPARAVRTARAAPTPLLARAAALLACAGIIVAVYASRSTPAEPSEPVFYRADAPASLEELRRWVRAAGIDDATAETRSVRELRSGRDLRLQRQFLEGAFDSARPAGRLTNELTTALEAELLTAPSRPVRTFGPTQHVVVARCGEHTVELRVTGCGTIPAMSVADGRSNFECAVTLRDRVVPIVVRKTLRDALTPQLIELTAHMAALRGIVSDRAGLRALATDGTKRLTPISMDSAATDEILALRRLSILDLRESPDLHDNRLLQRLTELPDLRTLLVDGSHIDTSELRAIGRITQLTELFFRPAGDDWLDAQISPSPNASGACITDANVAFLADLTELVELEIAGAQITDDGLARVAGLPKLKRLGLHGVDALTDGGMRTLSQLPLRSLDLSGTGLSIGSLPNTMRHVWVDANALFGGLPGSRGEKGRSSPRRNPQSLSLNIDGTGQTLNSESWRYLLTSLANSPDVKHIGIRNASVDDAALRALPAAVEKLDLGIIHCPNVSNEAIAEIDARPGYDCFRFSRDAW